MQTSHITSNTLEVRPFSLPHSQITSIANDARNLTSHIRPPAFNKRDRRWAIASMRADRIQVTPTPLQRSAPRQRTQTRRAFCYFGFHPSLIQHILLITFCRTGTAALCAVGVWDTSAGANTTCSSLSSFPQHLFPFRTVYSSKSIKCTRA